VPDWLPSLLDWGTREEEQLRPILPEFEDARAAQARRPGGVGHPEGAAFVDDLLAAAEGAVPREYRERFLRSMEDPAYAAVFWSAFFDAVAPAARSVVKQYVDELRQIAEIVRSFYVSVYFDPELWKKGFDVWAKERGFDAEAMREVRERLAA
jgi:hypothetical protein